jgi:hypothetical protein
LFQFRGGFCKSAFGSQEGNTGKIVMSDVEDDEEEEDDWEECVDEELGEDDDENEY